MLKLLNDSKYFEVNIYALHEAFDELNIEHCIVNKIDELDEDIYIICTTHENKPLPKNYISYNLEQLTTDKAWSPVFFSRLKKAKEIWDYSLENIKILKNRYGINNVKFVPIGYAKCMEVITKKTFEVDGVFLGCINHNRLNKLQNLMNIYYKNQSKFVVTNDCWGKDLISMYENAKICINLHFYGGNTILEVHRIIPMIANRVWVISEESNDSWYDQTYGKMLTFVKPSDLTSTYFQILKKSHEQLTNELEERYMYLKTHCRYVDFIQMSQSMILHL